MDPKKNAYINHVPNIFRILLVLGVVAFISLLFPNNAKFKYEFEKGQTWRYDDLVAPFDFPIGKPEGELRAEREAVLKLLSPVYEIDPTVAARQIEAFNLSFNEQLEAVREADQFVGVVNQPEPYRQYGTALLNRMYGQGIIELTPDHQDKGQDFVITILTGNEMREQTLQNVLTVGEVREMLSDSLPQSNLRQPEFILPLLERHIVPNLIHNDSLSDRLREQTLAAIPSSRGMVRKGELIIANGGIITDDIFQRLSSFREQYAQEVTVKQSYFGVFAGYCLLTGLVVTVFVVYLRYFAPVVYSRFHKLVFVMMWLVLYSYLVFIVEETRVLSPFLIPFCIVPIVVKTFFNERLALFTHIVTVLIASFLTTLGYEFTFLHLLAGIVVMLSDVDTRDWTRYFNSLIFIFLSYGLGFLGLSLIEEGDISKVDWTIFMWLFLNVFLTLLAYPLIPLVERLFGFVSPITLVELSDMNRPVLRELAMRAPGTLQHSLQVANMAESAARRIGANPLLVKVGALYHDIGKTNNPSYFIENQSGRNPHENLNPLESARIIISHVPDGVQLAKKHRLPAVLVDFIRTHHGTTRVEYFYRAYQQDHPDETVDEGQFRYPGPRPSSKEESLLLLADSVEAACRSLRNPTEEELYDLIDKVINYKISIGQLDDSQMSFRELEECRHVFRSVMKSVHHGRIEYPDEKGLPTGVSQLGDRQLPGPATS